MQLPDAKYFYSNKIDPFEERLREISNSKDMAPRPYKISFIIPPSPQEPTPGREFLITGPFEGFTHIATLAGKMGYPITVIDCRLKNNPEEMVLNGVSDADVIAIASFCDSFIFLEKITESIKKHYPDKLILLGGPLVSSLPDIVLQETRADCACLGEAELTFIEFSDQYLMNRTLDFTDIRGLAYKRNGSVIVNPRRPQIKNLDHLPFLDYTIWPSYESILKNGQILISSTRGCPEQCAFCFKTIPQFRMKSIDRFEKEVANLKDKTNFRYTWLNDLTFNVIQDRAMEICRILEKYRIQYHVFARVQNVHPPLMEKLKETGCMGIWFGFESYDQSILNYNRKNINVDLIDHAVKVANNAGLAVRGLFIVGLYQETEETLKRMLDFIEDNTTFLPLVKYLTPFPGTSVFHHAVDSGIIKNVPEFLRMLSGRKVRDHDDEIINITDLSEEVLRSYFNRIWEITKEREMEEKYLL